MNIHPDDPRLTSYFLGELPEKEAESIRQAVDEDPSLQSILSKWDELTQALANTRFSVSNTLFPEQRDAIRRTARNAMSAATPGIFNITKTSSTPWLVALATAAVITLASLLFIPPAAPGEHHALNPPAASPSQQPSLSDSGSRPLPAPGPPDSRNSIHAALKPSPGFPTLITRDSVAAADYPALELPILAGDSSFAWISESIRSQHRRPERDAVRLEEILNHFPLQAHGTSVIAHHPAHLWHPDDRAADIKTHAATITTESVICPWKPSASLVFISIQGNPIDACEIKTVFHANTTNIRRYRLLGFARAQGQTQGPLPTRLPAGAATSLVIEIEPSTASGDLGVIDWSVNGQAAAPLTLARHGDAEPSDDTRFAALICTFAQWLGGESSGLIDKDLLAALVRESTTASLPAERADFLKLIQQALEL